MSKPSWSELRELVENNPEKKWVASYGLATIDNKDQLVKENITLKNYRISTLRAITQILNILKVPYFLSDGSLLGWFRGEGMISHDPDTDISIMEEDMAKVWNSRNLLPMNMKMTCKDSDTGIDWVIDGIAREFNKSIPSAKKLIVVHQTLPQPPPHYKTICWEAVTDLYTFRKIEQKGRIYLANNYSKGNERLKIFPADDIFPLKESKFEGFNVLIPNNPESYLTRSYGYIGKDSYWDQYTKMYKKK
jgi:phosphorylcholine metabolism protein LicD